MKPALDRRQFLSAGAGLLGLLASASYAPIVRSQAASDEYRALVLVFQFGGVDCHDVIIPYDNGAYNEYAAIRANVLAGHGGSRTRDALLPLGPASAPYALPPELSALHSLFEEGSAAVVGNLGPLVEPVNRDQLDAGAVALPPRLFSHNDQQSVWQATAAEGALAGWGGIFTDIMVEQGMTPASTFAALTTARDSLFVTGYDTVPYVAGSGRTALDLANVVANRAGGNLRSLYEALIDEGQSASHILTRDLANTTVDGFQANEEYLAILEQAPDLGVTFAQSNVGSQFERVAKIIATREQFGVNRQVFLVGAYGYDTHSYQAGLLPGLHNELNAGVGTFVEALKNIGVFDQVTVATGSDFGRTLRANGDGTDHGWGGHHFVVGGAVNGGQLYGSIPDPIFEHAQDAGNGRLIPTISVEQYAAKLGSWLGLEDADLEFALPNWRNFNDDPLLGLMLG